MTSSDFQFSLLMYHNSRKWPQQATVVTLIQSTQSWHAQRASSIKPHKTNATGPPEIKPHKSTAPDHRCPLSHLQNNHSNPALPNNGIPHRYPITQIRNASGHSASKNNTNPAHWIFGHNCHSSKNRNPNQVGPIYSEIGAAVVVCISFGFVQNHFTTLWFCWMEEECFLNRIVCKQQWDIPDFLLVSSILSSHQSLLCLSFNKHWWVF